MKILFIAQGCIPFHHRTLDERPLGGIETGVIRLASAIKDLGHEVIVATSLANPPLSDPLYIPLTAINDVGPVDVLLAVRDWQTCFLPIQRKLTMFWTGDSYDQPQTVGIGDGRVIEKINLFLTVSNWQAAQFKRTANIPQEKLLAIGNGVHLEYFHGSEKRELHRLIYSSTPYRGLDLLPTIYRTIKQNLPTASLHVFSGFKVYEGAGDYPPEVLKRFEATKLQLSQLPDCFVHGNIRQNELAREFMKSALLCYPNTFEETSCITALEAQAAGCAIVSSNLGALPETTVGSSLLVNLERDGATYCNNFAGACLSILTDPMRWQAMSNTGLSKRAELSWGAVARRLLERIG